MNDPLSTLDDVKQSWDAALMSDNMVIIKNYDMAKGKDLENIVNNFGIYRKTHWQWWIFAIVESDRELRARATKGWLKPLHPNRLGVALFGREP